MRNLLMIVLFILFTGSAFGEKNIYAKIDTLKKGGNYILFSKSKDIETIEFNKKKKSNKNVVYIRFGYPTPPPSSNVNTTAISQGNRKYTEDGNLPVFDKIDILSGKYDDIKVIKQTKLKSLFTLTGLTFPLKLKLNSGTEFVEMELLEAGEWTMNIELKNN